MGFPLETVLLSGDSIGIGLGLGSGSGFFSVLGAGRADGFEGLDGFAFSLSKYSRISPIAGARKGTANSPDACQGIVAVTPVPTNTRKPRIPTTNNGGRNVMNWTPRPGRRGAIGFFPVSRQV